MNNFNGLYFGVSFNNTNSGVNNAQQTAKQYVEGLKPELRGKVVCRGLAADLGKEFTPNQEFKAKVKGFILKTVYDYNQTPAVKTDEKRLNAVCSLPNQKTVAVSLREDQLGDVFVGQEVTIKAASERFEVNQNRSMLSGEII